MSVASGLEHLKPFLPGLEDVLEDPEVSEIMINGPHNVWIEGGGKRAFSADDLVEQGSLPKNVRREAERVLRFRRNILVSGGTGSGKTTLLNALIELLPDDERIVAIEDTLELRIERSNCGRFEARGLETGAVTIRDLVRHALRHRPDHIVVGEVRGGEAADLLQALNTGHGGSLPWEVTCRGRVERLPGGARSAVMESAGVRISAVRISSWPLLQCRISWGVRARGPGVLGPSPAPEPFGFGRLRRRPSSGVSASGISGSSRSATTGP